MSEPDADGDIQGLMDMPITPEEREERRKSIGSSDAPAILGVSKWATPADIYYSKVLSLPDSNTEAQDLGNQLEGIAIERLSQELGLDISRDVKTTHPAWDILTSNHDGLIVNSARGVEAKAYGIVRPMPWEERQQWGESGSDQIPQDILVQVYHQIATGNLEVNYVTALIGGRGWCYFVIERPAEGVLQDLVQYEIEWWNDHVVARKAPNDAPPPISHLSILPRNRGELITVPVDIMQAYAMAKHETKQWGDAEEKCKAIILESMGDAEECEAFDADGAKYRMTYKEQKRKGLDAKALQRDHPEICKQYETETSYRVARFKYQEAEKKPEVKEIAE